MRKPTVAIIGGGIGGLATANLLARDSYEVTLYEQSAHLGGRAGLLEIDGFRFDTGPSWYLMPEVFEQYFAHFDARPSDFFKLHRLDPAYTVWPEANEPITIHADITRDSQTFETIEPGSGKRLQSYVAAARQTYQAAMDNFLYESASSIGMFIKPAVIREAPKLASLLTQSLHSYVAKRFKDRRLQQILEYQMVFLGASPWNAPALYSLMSSLDFSQGVFYPDGGIYAVIDALKHIGDQHRVTYHLNAPVDKIVCQNGQAIGIEVNGTFVPYDIVVSNADLHYTETVLLDTNERSYPQKYWDRKVASPSAVLLYLGVKGRLPQLTHHNLFFADAWKDNFDAMFKDKRLPQRPSLYVCKPSATDKTVAPKGYENLFVLVPIPAGISLSRVALQRAADSYIDQIGMRIAVQDLRSRLVVKEIAGPNYFADQFNAWQSTALGMAHTLGQSALWRPQVASKKLPNLYYVGANVQPGIGMPMCVISAELVHKAIVAHDRRAGR